MIAAAPRRAEMKDLASLAALERHFPSDALSRRSLIYLLRRPTAEVWVYDRQDTIAAALVILFRARCHTARLYSLIVDPALRGRGLGRAALALAEAAASARRCQRVVLEVRTDNLRAIAFYHRAGYEVTQRLEGYYEDGADGLRMEKPLSVAMAISCAWSSSRAEIKAA